MSYSQGIQFLESRGINLFHAFDTSDIAGIIGNAVPDLDLSPYPTTVLTAHAGFKFWQSMKLVGIQGDDPVDRYSVLLAQEYAERFLNCQAEILYPSDYPISLVSIAEKAGWNYVTPMGISIHPHYGTWFAYRTLFLIKTQLAPTPRLIAEHPCESCMDKPCQTVCPSGAVTEIGSFNLEACARYRIQDDSPCSYQCQSRNVCPVGAQYKYVPEQMKYHYRRSRNTMKRYFGSEAGN